MESETQTSENTIEEMKAEEMYAKDGTDLTLIRWMLAMTPEERLRQLQSQVNSVMRMRRGLTRV